jgi:hypothetical protein
MNATLNNCLESLRNQTRMVVLNNAILHEMLEAGSGLEDGHNFLPFFTPVGKGINGQGIRKIIYTFTRCT